MNKVDYLILGGGIAGTTAAETIRSHSPQASIAILTQEEERLYSRVLLPHFLRNENQAEEVFLRTRESYKEKRLDLYTSTKVSKVDTAAKTVSLDSGEEWGFDKLLIATGGKVNALDVPGGLLPQVTYLRTLSDAKKIKELMGKSKKAVVIGSGFIGIELAQSFIANNLETTLLIREKYFWEKVVGEETGALLTKILTDNGVVIKPFVEVEEFIGQDSLEGVKLKNNEIIPADLVGVGIGIHLDLDFVKDSGIVVKKGIVTNEFLETSVPGVWAAGDVAEFYDPLFKHYHALGNWANASAQGRAVGANMSSERTAFETTSLYSINIFKINLSFLGDTLVNENTQVVERGSSSEGKISRLLLREGKLVGASILNAPLERGVLSQLIKNQVKIDVSTEKLADLTFDLNSLLS